MFLFILKSFIAFKCHALCHRTELSQTEVVEPSLKQFPHHCSGLWSVILCHVFFPSSSRWSCWGHPTSSSKSPSPKVIFLVQLQIIIVQYCSRNVFVGSYQRRGIAQWNKACWTDPSRAPETPPRCSPSPIWWCHQSLIKLSGCDRYPERTLLAKDWIFFLA